MDSPVNVDSYTYKAIALINLISAGIISPPCNIQISPGTNSFAEITYVFPFLITVVFLACISSNASSFRADFNSCQTPIVALAISMRRITIGSTYAVQSSVYSSKYAIINEIIAATKRSRTNLSSN